ncbi:MAG: glycosyltransferase family 2 protein [Oscillospiraceae bacterium]|nr:glycosyltransferase family 2 protein [Oscillospiraceae bacterium]
MKLSVIVPAYNAEKTLRTCLDSILAQTRPADELIVINDGSKDATESILREYAEQHPACFRYQTVENGGQGRARNIGFELSTGDWIGYVDSDDWIDPEMYEKLLDAAERENSDMALCEVLAHYPDGRTEKEYIYRPDRAIAATGFPNNKLFRRELIEHIRYPEEKLWYEDAEYTAVAIHRAKKITHLPETLYHYRRGLPSTMNNNNAQKNLDLLTVMMHLEDEFLPEDRDDFEFLVLNHILLDGMNRVQAMTAEDKKEVLWLMREYVKDKIPKLSASRSFREETRNRRIIMRLHYLGLSDLAAAILNMKNGR